MITCCSVSPLLNNRFESILEKDPSGKRVFSIIFLLLAYRNKIKSGLYVELR
jgi:hypothetical protein